jgi:hypothetical protein
MNKVIDFLKPRLVGKRFENHSIPLEVLGDLSVLQDMINETARWLYLNEHEGRSRIPKGFMDGISIKLTDIEEGSAIPKLVLVISTAIAELLPSANQLYFEKARDKIINAIDAAEYNENITTHLPEHLLVYFDKLGRGLLDDEQIEFRPEDIARPARLNKTTRKTLILSSSKVKDYTEEVELIGTVHEADQKRNTFTVNLRDGQEIASSMDILNKDLILEAFTSFKDGQKISIKGIGRYNRDGKLIKIEIIEHVALIDQFDIPTRLNEIAQFEDGWLDGKGKSFDGTKLKWIEELFDTYYDTSLILPCLYPTVEGNIQAEWSIKDWEVSIEINLESKSGEFQAVNIKSDSINEKVLDLENKESWDEINSILKSIVGDQA